MSLAQIGEFAFVLLSRASNLHLVEVSGSLSKFKMRNCHYCMGSIHVMCSLEFMNHLFPYKLQAVNFPSKSLH